MILKGQCSVTPTSLSSAPSNADSQALQTHVLDPLGRRPAICVPTALRLPAHEQTELLGSHHSRPGMPGTRLHVEVKKIALTSTHEPPTQRHQTRNSEVQKLRVTLILTVNQAFAPSGSHAFQPLRAESILLVLWLLERTVGFPVMLESQSDAQGFEPENG